MAVDPALGFVLNEPVAAEVLFMCEIDETDMVRIRGPVRDERVAGSRFARRAVNMREPSRAREAPRPLFMTDRTPQSISRCRDRLVRVGSFSEIERSGGLGDGDTPFRHTGSAESSRSLGKLAGHRIHGGPAALGHFRGELEVPRGAARLPCPHRDTAPARWRGHDVLMQEVRAVALHD